MTAPHAHTLSISNTIPMITTINTGMPSCKREKKMSKGFIHKLCHTFLKKGKGGGVKSLGKCEEALCAYDQIDQKWECSPEKEKHIIILQTLHITIWAPVHYIFIEFKCGISVCILYILNPMSSFSVNVEAILWHCCISISHVHW